MLEYFRLSAFFTLGTYHGKEWPPSPMKLFQAIIGSVAALSAKNSMFDTEVLHTLEWFEGLKPPIIYSEESPSTSTYSINPPNNNDDKTMSEYTTGSKKEFLIIKDKMARNTTKKITRRFMSKPVHYFWQIEHEDKKYADHIITLAEYVSCLGRGIDSAWIQGCIEKERPNFADMKKWIPSSLITSHILYSPASGSLKSLVNRELHRRNRMETRQFVDPPIVFDRIYYDVSGKKNKRPCRIYDIRKLDGSAFQPWMQENLIVLTGMVRHQLGKLHNGDALSSFVMGHGIDPSWRLSWVPLPSIGHKHADGLIRRIMIMGPNGADENLMDRALHGMQFAELESYENKEVVAFIHEADSQEKKMEGSIKDYFGQSNQWYSVTPVLLPGYVTRGHDQKGKLVPQKIEKLVQNALESSGLPEAKEIIIQKAPFLKNGVKAGDFQTPKHLSRYPQYHLKITFPFTIEGPVVAGVGRHYGLGLFAASRTTG